MPDGPEARGLVLSLPDRAPIYAWLARLLVCEVGPDVWRTLRSDPIRPILGRLDRSLDRQLESGLGPAEQEQLAEEYARLFLLPRGVPPFASSWQTEADDRERGRDEILAMVARGFLAIDRERIERAPWGRLPGDHVAVILDLVSQAACSEDPAHREIAAQLDDWLVRPWLMPFGTALREQADVPLYRALGALIVSLGALA